MQESPTVPNPFILTLAIEEEAQTFFNQLRQQYFPPDKNFLAAHLTLFHYLPLTADELMAQLQSAVATQSRFLIQVTDVVSIGKGVAYKLETKELQALHRQLQQLWKPLLKPQDLQKLWPHITVQNKVTPQEAAATLPELKNGFQPFTFGATGLSLWEYLGGPWRWVATLNFSEETHL
jgi:2'-5' RNA ligase